MTPHILFQRFQYPTLQNRLYRTAAEARQCPHGDITLVQDPAWGIVHNASFQPDKAVYDSLYNNEQSASLVFQDHMRTVQSIVEKTMGTKGLVEIGCGKGTFLEQLQANGFDVTGYDPAYEGSNFRVERRVFTPAKGTSANGIILRHVLEHIQSPVAFLHEIAKSNGHQGFIYIEVPCFDWILRHNAWWDIFYEHANYFRADDFRQVFRSIVDIGHIFGGQYIYVVADLASIQSATDTPSPEPLIPDRLTPIVQLDNRYSAHAIWGAGSKGCIFALAAERGGQPIALAVDIHPAKHNLHLPMTGIRVISPHEAIERLPANSCIHVMNPNYLDEVMGLVKNRYHLAVLGG
jgi:SAM-dependent methyltransferase